MKATVQKNKLTIGAAALQDSGGSGQTVSANGSIYNGADYSMLFGVTVSYVDINTNQIFDSVTLDNASNTYTAWTYRPDQLNIIFSKPGFQSVQIPFSELLNVGDIYLQPASGASADSSVLPNVTVTATTTAKKNILPIALLIGAGLLLTTKKKNMGTVTPDDVKAWTPIALVGVGLIVLWPIIKPLLNLVKGVGDVLANPGDFLKGVGDGILSLFGGVVTTANIHDAAYTLMYNYCSVNVYNPALLNNFYAEAKQYNFTADEINTLLSLWQQLKAPQIVANAGAAMMQSYKQSGNLFDAYSTGAMAAAGGLISNG